MGAHGEVPGIGYHWEIESHVMGGMAPMAALHAATAGSAETIGRLDDLGTIEPGKLARQFRYADRAGIRFVLVLGSDEIAKGTVTIKDLRRQDQFEIARGELADSLHKRLLSDDAR